MQQSIHTFHQKSLDVHKRKEKKIKKMFFSNCKFFFDFSEWVVLGPAYFSMNFHFSRNKWAGPGPAHFLANLVKSGPAHFQNRLNFWSWGKKVFCWKIFFLRVLWTSKLFWLKVWILYYIWPANLSGKACILISVAAFFSRFR